MSLLQTFFIAFDTNASKAEKEVTQSLGNMASRAMGAIGAFASIGAVMNSVFVAANYSDQLYELADALEINGEELGAWGQAAKMSGGSAEEFNNTVGTLSKDLAAFAATGRAKVAPFFKELGVGMVDAQGKARGVMDVLPDLAKAFEGLSKQESFGLGQKMGLDKGTIMMLQKGEAGVLALVKAQKEFGTVAKKDAEAAAKFNDEVDTMSYGFTILMTKIGGAILPAFSSFLRVVQDAIKFFSQHKDVVVGFFMAVTGAILAYYLPAIGAAAVSTLAAIGPYLLVAAAIVAFGAAIALVYDDIMTFIEGGDSVIGMVVRMAQAFGGDVMAAIDTFFGGLAIWIDSTIEKLQPLIDAFKKVKEFGGNLVKGAGELVSMASNQLTEASASPLGATSSAAIMAGGDKNSSNSIKIDNLTVTTQATDAQGVASGINTELQSQMAAATSSYDDGVSH